MPVSEYPRSLSRSLSRVLTYADVVIQLYSPRRVQLHLLQSLSNNIIWLSLAGLGGLYRRRLVNISLVVDIQLPERILQAKDLILLELRIFPKLVSKAPSPLNAGAYLCNLITFIALIQPFTGSVLVKDSGRKASTRGTISLRNSLSQVRYRYRSLL